MLWECGIPGKATVWKFKWENFVVIVQIVFKKMFRFSIFFCLFCQIDCMGKWVLPIAVKFWPRISEHTATVCIQTRYIPPECASIGFALYIVGCRAKMEAFNHDQTDSVGNPEFVGQTQYRLSGTSCRLSVMAEKPNWIHEKNSRTGWCLFTFQVN